MKYVRYLEPRGEHEHLRPSLPLLRDYLETEDTILREVHVPL